MEAAPYKAISKPSCKAIENTLRRPDPVRVNSLPDWNGTNLYSQICYNTDRGNLPTKIIRDNLQMAPKAIVRKRYPATYRNADIDENGNPIFPQYQVRGRKLMEVPINTTNFNFQRPNSNPKRRDKWENPSVDERQGLWKDERPGHCYNTPGPYRAVLAIRAEGDPEFLGVMAHPLGNSSGFHGATIQPMQRQDRQDVIRHIDQFNRMGTWPPRGRDGNDYARMEEKFKGGKPKKESREHPKPETIEEPESGCTGCCVIM